MSRLLEHTDELGQPLTPRCGERCLAVLVRDVGTSAGSEQAPDHRHIAAQGRDEKCGSSPSIALFRAHSAAQELIDAVEVPRFGCADQR
jgi:hypothetical protein